MRKITFFAALLLFLPLFSAYAQTSDLNEKQKAVKELVALMNPNNDMDEFMRAFMMQMNSTRSEIVKGILDERTDLTKNEKISLEKSLTEEAAKEANKIQERFMKELDYNKLLNEITETVWDKFYTLEEVKDLIAFYKTPTGQKVIKNMQPQSLEILRLTQERITPKLIAIIDEMSKEQRKLLAEKANKLKPRRTKTKANK